MTEPDPRIPGIRAAIEFLGGAVDRLSGCKVRGLELASQELFHVKKEMEAWLESIEEGETEESDEPWSPFNDDGQLTPEGWYRAGAVSDPPVAPQG